MCPGAANVAATEGPNAEEAAVDGASVDGPREDSWGLKARIHLLLESEEIIPASLSAIMTLYIHLLLVSPARTALIRLIVPSAFAADISAIDSLDVIHTLFVKVHSSCMGFASLGGLK